MVIFSATGANSLTPCSGKQGAPVFTEMPDFINYSCNAYTNEGASVLNCEMIKECIDGHVIPHKTG